MTTLNSYLASFALVMFASACGGSRTKAEDLDRRLTQVECTAAVDHATTLLEADPPSAPAGAALRASSAVAIDQCLATATLRDHRCLMAANDARGLGLCPMPGSSGER